MYVLPFFASLVSGQERLFPSCAQYARFELPTTPNALPPFIVKMPLGQGNFDSFRVYAADNSLAFEPAINATGRKLYRVGLWDYFVYYGANLAGMNLPCGEHYIRLSDGDHTRISAGFEVHTNADLAENYTLLQWRHPFDVYREYDEVFTPKDFAARLYLPGKPEAPSFPLTSTEEEDPTGLPTPSYRRIAQQRRLQPGPLPPFLVEALGFMRAFDEVTVAGSRVYNIDFEGDPSWPNPCRADLGLVWDETVLQTVLCGPDVGIDITPA